MNFLAEDLPQVVVIDDIEYKIDSDFRTLIRIESIINNSEMNEEEKVSRCLEFFYEIIPNNLQQAVREIGKFYNCYKEEDRNYDVEENSREKYKTAEKKIYDYDYDSGYIYAAFLQQYGIDLMDIKYLHWFKFRCLFSALTEDTEFVKILGYRSVELHKIKDKEQKEFYRKKQEYYRLPNNEVEDKHRTEITKILMGDGDFSKLKHEDN